MDKLRAAYRVAVIIGLAMMATLLVYTVVVGILEKDPALIRDTVALPGNQVEIIKFALIGVTVVLFFVIRFVNSLLLKPREKGRTTPDARSKQTGELPEFGILTTAAVITYALCEAPAIFGLVLFFLGRNSSDFHLFLFISLVYFAVHFPKFSRWEEWYQEQAVRR